jgi:hypothetical protein
MTIEKPELSGIQILTVLTNNFGTFDHNMCVERTKNVI